MSNLLVRPLFDGSLDIVGDVHGEIDSLRSLMDRLGYDPSGVHPHGRKLVFVGDLCDRGPDSPAVIRLVRDLVDAGLAQYVIGNHELNLLRREHKSGNAWFYGTMESDFETCAPAPKSEREGFLAFFRSLPVALEGPRLRVVHAAWRPAAIESCRSFTGTVDDAYAHFDKTVLASPEGREIEARGKAEEHQNESWLHDKSKSPPHFLHNVARYDAYYQMSNPVRVLTSGVEVVTDRPFFAGGKWRFVERAQWWRSYEESSPVVFGHYWRWWNPRVQAELSKGEPYLFKDEEDPAGWHHNERGDDVAFCVDYSIGAKYKEVKKGSNGPFHARLAAMRWPERTVMFDSPDPV